MTDSIATLLSSSAAGFCIQVGVLETTVLLVGLGVARSLGEASRPARYLVLQTTLVFVLMTPALVGAVYWTNLGWIPRSAESNTAVLAIDDARTAELELAAAHDRLDSRVSAVPDGNADHREKPGSLARNAAKPIPEPSTELESPIGDGDTQTSASTRAAVEAPRVGSRLTMHSIVSSIGRVLLGVWLLVAAFLLLRLLLGFREIRRLRILLRRVEDSEALAILDEIVAEAATGCVPRLMTSPAVLVPMTIGVIRPIIALPGTLLDGATDDKTLKAVLLHETAHVARRDLLTAFLERLAMVLYWWHPLVYRLCARVDELREDICDNWAVRAQGHGETLARCLVDLAAAMCGGRSDQPVAIAPHRLTVGALGLDNDGLHRRVARLLRLSTGRTGGNHLLEGKETMIQTTWRTRVGVGVFILLLLGLFLATGVRQVPARESESANEPAEATTTKASGKGVPTLTGSIVDPAGKPVAGAKVWLVKRGERWPDPAITDDGGRYSIEYDRPAETTGFCLWVESADATMGGAKGFVILGEGEEEVLGPITVELGAIQSVTVSVKSGDGQPIQGAEVELVPDYRQHLSTIIAPKTGAEGVTRVRLPREVKISYVLAVKSGEGLDYLANCTGTFRANDTIPERIELCLDGVTTVRLRINDTNGQPIAGLPLSGINDLRLPGQPERLYYYDGVITKTHTNDQGEVVFDYLPTGVVNDRFTVTPLSDEWTRDRIAVSDYLSTSDVTAVLNRRQIISGRVTFPDGTPAERVRIFAEGVDLEDRYCREGFGADTLSDGSYSIRADAGKIYALRAKCDGWATAFRLPIELAEDQPTEDVDFELSKGTLVHGKVRISGNLEDHSGGKAGKPDVVMGLSKEKMPEPMRRLWGPYPNVGVGFAVPDFRDGEGEYAFRVEPGDYIIRFQIPGAGNSQEREISVGAEDEIRIDFEGFMPGNRKLHIHTVLAEDGTQVVPDVVVRYDAYIHSAWVGEYFVTSAQGECTTPTICNEQFLRGRTRDLRLGGKATIDDKATSVTIPMMPTATVKGRFVDNEGEPMANRKVEVTYRPEIERVWGQRDDEIAFRTDETGSFEIRGLIAGIDYQVHLAGSWEWKKGKPTNGTPVAAKEGETVDLGAIVIAGG